MGTWGYGIFENDSAADWVYAYESDGAVAVERALSAVSDAIGQGHLDADTAAIALGAAEAIAFAAGVPSSAVNQETLETFARHSEAVHAIPEGPLRALKVVASIFGRGPDGVRLESELLDLWSEEDVAKDDFDGFKQTVQDLAIRLKRVMQA